MNGLQISSPAFENNQPIPAKYTCDGENINPPFKFSGIPVNCKSLVLICDDPDAPAGTFCHWTLWNINPQENQITENSVPAGAIEGVTSFGRHGYGGPCPPAGTHRYIFKLFALDIKLALPPTADRSQLAHAIQGHILEQTQIIGLYRRV